MSTLRRCPITYEPLAEGAYDRAGLRRLSPRLETLHPLLFTSHALRREALARASKMSIQGVQPKVSARLNVKASRFELVDRGGRYILKPQTENYTEVPENEDVTMHMAALAGVEVPLHGLIYTAEGALCYFIRRFDRVGRSSKQAVEDFAQLTERTRDTKYDASMEKVLKVVNQYCTFPAVERVKLFRRTLVAYLTGNEDLHLKNFSLITREGKVELSPAYDLLNSTIILANPVEELALPLRGKKSRFRKSDLVDYWGSERLQLTPKMRERVLSDLATAIPEWHDLLKRSFLSSAMQEAYRDVLVTRQNVLGL